MNQHFNVFIVFAWLLIVFAATVYIALHLHVDSKEVVPFLIGLVTGATSALFALLVPKTPPTT
jgi:hypothetical protein